MIEAIQNPAVAIGLAVGGILLLGSLARATSAPKYVKQEHFYSKAERSFFGVLESAIDANHRLFGKVRVADILTPQKTFSKNAWWKAFVKISSKHFDYVICDRHTLMPVAVVELDDKSHQSAKVMERDRFIDLACQQAGLPIIRFEAKARYNPGQVRAKIQDAILITASRVKAA
jgi:very-short-patch-repair endonuclease